MSRGCRLGALLLSLGPLVAVWLLLSPGSVPLYDGINFSTYRYLHTPPDQPNNGLPYSARVSLPILGGDSPIAKIHTPDPKNPQAYLVLRYRALNITPGVRTVILSIKPVDPPAPLPKHRVFDGNVYHYAATTPNGAPVPLRSGVGAVVELLGTGASGTGTIARYVSRHWRLLTTVYLSGQGYFVARTPALGDFTIILVPRHESALSAALPFIIAGILVALLLAAGIILIRTGRAAEPVT